jgi:DNA polymerase III epsilon subunit family exonuclease
MTVQFGSTREFIALDLETTGLSAATDRIVEVAAVRFDETGEDVDFFQSLVNPEQPVSPGAYAVHGLSDNELAQAPTAREVLPHFLAFLGEPESSPLIAHNASFDAGFLGSELQRAGLAVPGHSLYDTLALSRTRLPMLASHRLDSIARYFGLDPTGAHRAMADTRLVKEIWLRLGGHRESAAVISFRMFDARQAVPVPEGWEALAQAVARGAVLQIEYEGGTRGSSPRSVTPRRLESRGGSTFLVAYCHLDSLEKSFRVDRIRAIEFSAQAGSESVRVERGAAGG